MTTEQIKAAIHASLHHIAPEADPASLDPDLDLRDQLDIDSMDFLNYVLGLNQATGVEIPERDYPKLASINDATAYLGAHVAVAA